MARSLYLTRLNFGQAEFIVESFLDTRGEDDPIVSSCLQEKFDENDALSYWGLLAHLSKPGDLLLDVGAYAGLFSLVAARFNLRVKVAAFEASAATYGRLVRNIILNRLEARICAANYGAWHEPTVLQFAHLSGIYSMSPGTSAVHEHERQPDFSEPVITIRLDDLLAEPDELPGPFGSRSLGIREARNISAIKIDVEGAECNVIRGATKILTQHRPFVICELLTREAIESAKELLSKLDYEIEPVANERRNFLLVPVEKKVGFHNAYAEWKQGPGRSLMLSAERTMMMAF